MAAILVHVRSLLLVICLVQSVSLYKILSSDNELLDVSGSSLNNNINTPFQADNSAWEKEDMQAKRSLVPIGFQAIPQRRTYRPHWNPLIAAYRRCGELIREDREPCFKEAVQMLFVHNIRK